MYRMMLALPIMGFMCGCAEEPDDRRNSIVADKTTSDQQAIERLAEDIFTGLKSQTATVADNGRVKLSVIVQVSDDTEVKTLEGGASAAEIDRTYVLGTSLFNGRDMIRYGRQRSLTELVISIRHTALDENGKRTDVDIFKYAVSQDRFDDYLNTGSALDIVQGDALRIIKETCEIEYDRFDDLQYLDIQ